MTAKQRKKRLGTLLVWLLLAAAFFFLFNLYRSDKPERIRQFAMFRLDVALGRVARVWVNNNEITVELADTGEKYSTFGVVDDELTAQLSEQRVPILRGEEKSPWGSLLVIAVPVLLVLALLWYLVRKARGGTTDLLSLGKSLARLIPEKSKVTFADVGGCDEAKLMLGDVIDFLKHPQRWSQAGVRLPRGVLLEGPPGCGKTLLARAVAGETSARFYLGSASEFVEMFVGVGAARVRDTFETARKNAPAVIFIDELDAVGRRRGSGVGASHDEREQTLNQLLVCLDGFEGEEAVVVIAATNRPDILDPALLRSGRIDRRIKIGELSREARLEILRIHTRNKTLAGDVSLTDLADWTAGFNGAQLENLANEAALLAVRRARDTDGEPVEVRMDDFLRALEPTAVQTRMFNKIDAVLIESTTQLAEPTGRAVVRLVLDGASAVEGQLVWADANFIKVRSGAAETIVPKAQIRRIEALEGTEAADPLDVVPDPWAGRHPDMA